MQESVLVSHEGMALIREAGRRDGKSSIKPVPEDSHELIPIKKAAPLRGSFKFFRLLVFLFFFLPG